MITLEDYFGPYKGHQAITKEIQDNARGLLDRVRSLASKAMADGIKFPDNPATGTVISGQGNGGWRPPECKVGAPSSSHKEGKGIDLYDPEGDIDLWCIYHIPLLKASGIHIESPSATRGWSHWTTRPPRSGLTVFNPKAPRPPGGGRTGPPDLPARDSRCSNP